MLNKDLHFNIIPFDFPNNLQTFYFSLAETNKCVRIHKKLFPTNIATIFPEITEEVDYIYTSFDYAKEGFEPLEIDFKTENEYLLKKFYNRRIKYFFGKEKHLPIRSDFIGNNQVWVGATQSSTKEFKVYRKFTLKVQFCTVSKKPELLLSYDGRAKVFKKNLSQTIKEVSTSILNWIIYDGSLYEYEDFSKIENTDYKKAYAVVNLKIADVLNILPFENKKENKYKNYKEVIEIFYDHLLNNPAFRKHIPISEEFLKVEESLIDYVEDASNELAFKEGDIGRTPKKDFYFKKPFLKCPHKNVHLFYIYHKDDEDIKDKLEKYFDKGLGHYKGLTDYTGILYHPDVKMNICFADRENPLQEIQQYLNKVSSTDDSIKYLAIYVTPFTKDETRKQEIRVYVRVKELLLEKNIACQFVEPETVNAPTDGFKWSLTTMSVAILAKLGGIPWQLATEIKNELIIGIGAFRHPDGVQYLSSAFSFNNTGHFNEFEYFLKHENDVMAANIAIKVKEFAASFGNPSRLIIHFYKEKMNSEEIAQIETSLKTINLPSPIPIFIVHVNKTEAKDIIAFDYSWEDNWMPYSGTYISVGNKKYLLFTNSRYPTETFSKTDGFPFPIKLSIDCTDEKQLNDEQTINDLINQVYQFSRMYFKSLSQQNLPVTVKYPEIIAELAPYTANAGLPDNSKNNLWFL